MKLNLLRKLGKCGPGFLVLVILAGCGSDGNQPASRRGGEGGSRRGMAGMAATESAAAVPVRVTAARRQAIGEYLETNGVLEAENEVDIVSRVSGPIVELVAEEGMEVTEGQLLARIDERDYRTQVRIAEVSLHEAELAFDRAQVSWDRELISREAYDSALSARESAQAQGESSQIALEYTAITAPFAGIIVRRYIKLAEHVGNNAQLFRISDFKPLLCPIQVPEKDLARLSTGQPAHLTVEAFQGVEFAARVLRISPVVDSATGTVKVTLEVSGQDKLRPGMFASIFLETDRHPDALVIPRRALVLDSIGDTVFVKQGDSAARREVLLGFREEDSVEVLEGVDDGEHVIVLGQDGLSDGTPVSVLGIDEPARSDDPGPGPRPGPRREARSPDHPGPGDPGPEPGRQAERRPPPAEIDDQQLEMMRNRMRERGMSDQEIAQRIEEHRAGGRPGPPPDGQRPRGQGGEPPPRPEDGRGPGRGGPRDRAGGRDGGGRMPPHVIERIRNATPEQLEEIKRRMRDRGLSEEEIAEWLRQIRDPQGNESSHEDR